jgi:hypothetical protein
MRWWDGNTWTENVADGQQQSVDTIAAMPPPTAPTLPVPAAPAPTNWRDRPESVGAFIVNLVFCLVFPIFTLWYAPKYVMRHEYGKAITCVAVPVIAIMLLAMLLAA